MHNEATPLNTTRVGECQRSVSEINLTTVCEMYSAGFITFSPCKACVESIVMAKKSA